MAYGDNGYGDEFLRGVLFDDPDIRLQLYRCASCWDCSVQARSSAATRSLYRIGDLYTTLVRAIPELLLILMIYYMGSQRDEGGS